MATEPRATAVPPVEVVLGDVVANLAILARAYVDPPAEAGAEADLDAADALLDVAGRAYDRIQPRVGSDERSALAGLLTAARLSYVKKRGL
jgi:hypothetical protein